MSVSDIEKSRGSGNKSDHIDPDVHDALSTNADLLPDAESTAHPQLKDRARSPPTIAIIHVTGPSPLQSESAHKSSTLLTKLSGKETNSGPSKTNTLAVTGQMSDASDPVLSSQSDSASLSSSSESLVDSHYSGASASSHATCKLSISALANLANSFQKRVALFKAIRGATSEYANSNERKAEVTSAQEKNKHKLPPSIYKAFQAKNPYRSASAPGKLKEKKLKVVGHSPVIKEVVSLHLDTARKNTDRDLVAHSGKLSLTGVQFAAEVLERQNQKESEASEKKILLFKAPKTITSVKTIKSISSNKALRSSYKITDSKGLLLRQPSQSRNPSFQRTKSYTASQEAVRRSLENLRQGMRDRHLLRKSRHRKLDTAEQELHACSEKDVDVEFAVDVVSELPIDKFIRKSWLVFMLCKVCFGLRKYAFEGGVDPRSFEAYIPHNLLSARGDAELPCFNPADYKALGEATWHAAAWQSILKPVGTRGRKDLFVIKNIMRSIKEFNEYPSHIQTTICQYIRYERFGKNRVVIRRGDIGYQYYFVYSGKVHITYATRGHQLYSKGASLKTLQRGDSFGEQALMGEEPRHRTATVICCENCEFLTIDCTHFEASGLKMLLLSRMGERLKMIRSFELFESWSDEQIEELSNFSVTEYYGYKKVVVGDARRNDFIYLCIKGRCEILRLVDLTTSPLYGKALKKQPMENLQSLTDTIFRKPGITLRDDLILDALSWWSDDLYHEKYMEIKTKHDRHLGMSRDISTSNFVDETGQIVRGSTINVIKQLGVNSGQSAAMVFEDQSRLDLQAKGTANTMTVNTCGTNITFKRQTGININIDEKTPHGVFMKVSELSRGGWFGYWLLREAGEDMRSHNRSLIILKSGDFQGIKTGIKDLWGPVSRCSLISLGCSLVRIPKSKLYEMIDMETLKKLRFCALTEQIPPDKELSREAMARMLWTDTVKEAGRQAYHNQQIKKSTEQFKAATQLLTTFNDRDYKNPVYYMDERKAVRKPLLKPPKKLKMPTIKVGKGSESTLPKGKRIAHFADAVMMIVQHKRRRSRIAEASKLEIELSTATLSTEMTDKNSSLPSDSDKQTCSEIEAPKPRMEEEKHPEEIKESQAKIAYNRKIHRLFMLARLRALQTLIHIEETAADKELNNHIDKILNGLMPELPRKGADNKALNAGPSRVDVCPLPAIHARSDPILDAKSRLPIKLKKTQCKAILTKQLSHNGVRTVRLIEGLHSPLNPPAIKKISIGYD